MNTKALCITVLVITVLIFWANHSAARNECESEDGGCEKCKCEVTITVKNPDLKKEPSCSVLFRGTRKRLSSVDEELVELDKSVNYTQTFDSCGFLLYCDKEASAKLRCQDERTTPLSPIMGPIKNIKSTNIWGNQMCSVSCEYRSGFKIRGISLSDSEKVIRTTCGHWERPAPPAKKPPEKKPPGKKAPGKKPGMATLSSMFLGAGSHGPSDISAFAPDLYSEETADEQTANDQETREIITDATRWKTRDGVAGMEQGILTVAAGEAEAHNLCTGDTISLAGPTAVSMPSCPGDVAGHWEGAYARPRPKGARPDTPRVVVSMSLDLRRVGNSIRGELKTRDGTFNISASESDSTIRIEAVRAAGGKINLQGKMTKGSIVLGGSEQSPEGVTTYRLVGFARRSYIADAALPPALVNMPYNFALTAFAPEGQPLTFRLGAPPAITYPEINWFTQAERTRGRDGERFTYLCPANGSLGGALYGTDTYSDSSSICKAAVHAGLIKQQSGGVVSIQNKPDAGSYTATTRNGVLSSRYSFGTGKGAFVFVSLAANDKRGRLPQGITFDTSSGTFSGTPTETGNFDFNIIADDGEGNLVEQPLTLTVKKIVLTNRLLHDGFVGEPYAATLNVTGGRPPYRFSATMPKDFQLDPATGAVTGTPSSPISFAKVEIMVRDGDNTSESQTVTLSVRGATIMNSHFLPDASVGTPYRAQFQMKGTQSPVHWIFGPTDATLIGLRLNEQTGELFGTPTRAGDFFIQVRGEVGNSVPTRGFALTVR